MSDWAIRVKDLRKRYRGRDGPIDAVDGLDLEVPAGECFGLLGPNGAGKTTTLRALCGIITPTHGRLLIAGRDIVHDPVGAKAALGYVPDDPQPFDRLTLWEHFRFVAAAYRLRDWTGRAEALLARLELTEKRDALASELSRGMRQKLAVACGLLHLPRALLLDEPFTGLDTTSRERLERLIDDLADDGRTLMIATHDIAQTGSWDRVLCLHHRQIAYGPPAVALSASVLEATYGQAVVRLTEGEGALAVVDDHGC